MTDVDNGTRPAGVCPVNFDHHSLEHARNPQQIFRQIREQGGVAHGDNYGGYYVLTRYEDVTNAARDWETFSSDRDQNGPGSGGGGLSIPSNPGTALSLDELDPPEWKRIRSAMSPTFAPGAITRRMPRMKLFTDEFIDRVIESGRCDLVLDIANPIPAVVTLDILGFPLEEWERYADPIHKMTYMRRDHEEYADTLAGTRWILDQIRERIAALRKNPGDDYVSGLITHDPQGRPFDDLEIEEAVFISLAGGIDTTTALMSNAFHYLGEHPDERDRLRENPELIDTACQEFLRVITPVQALARTVTRTTEVGGVELNRGDRVLLSWASANQDAEQFPNAEEIQLDRFPNRHCAFGMGIHRCLGSNLAKTQFRVIVEEVLRRMPDYRVLPGARRYPRLGVVNGWESMPVEFTPGRASR